MRGLALVLAGWAGVASAADNGPAYRPAPLQVVNGTDAPLICRAVIAHWYLNEYGPAAPGEAVVLPLRFEPVGGTVSILNAVGDEMAVERLICGPEGAVYADGRDLPYKELSAMGGGAVTCQTSGDGLSCD